MTAEPARRPSREYRAAAVLLVTGVFTVVVVLLYRDTISSVPAIRDVTLAGYVLGAVVELLIAVALAWRLSWAHPTMTPALRILALSGVLTFVASIVGGRLDVPIGGILAIWALRAPPRAAPDTGAGQPVGVVLGAILVVVLAVVAAWPVIVPTATRPGGPLIADVADLHLEVQTTAPCPGGAGAVHDPPEAIDVVVRWTWARAEPIRAGTDAVVLSWATMAGNEGIGGYYLGEPIQQQPGITEEDRSAVFAVYSNDLGARGFEPGSVTIRLTRPNEIGSGPGLVQVAATYVHHYTGMSNAKPVGLWTHAESLSCEW